MVIFIIFFFSYLVSSDSFKYPSEKHSSNAIVQAHAYLMCPVVCDSELSYCFTSPAKNFL